MQQKVSKLIHSKLFKNFKFKITILIVLASFLLIAFWGMKNQESTVTINNYTFKIETVSTPEAIQKGLGGRDNLCENCGMIFIFSKEGRHAFWMKGMRFNIDIIWIEDNKIVYIAKNVEYTSKEVIIPEMEADQVLEINAGMTDKLGIKIGDEAHLVK